MCEQTVNGRFRRFLLSIYMGKMVFALDFSGILWYHMGVKLGCYATASHGFDLVFRAFPRGWLCGRDRVAANGRSALEGKENRMNSACPAPYVSRCFRLRALDAVTPPLRVPPESARLPGRPIPADAQER